jgi:hypothetical protein
VKKHYPEKVLEFGMLFPIKINPFRLKNEKRLKCLYLLFYYIQLVEEWAKEIQL